MLGYTCFLAFAAAAIITAVSVYQKKHRNTNRWQNNVNMVERGISTAGNDNEDAISSATELNTYSTASARDITGESGFKMCANEADGDANKYSVPPVSETLNRTVG